MKKIVRGVFIGLGLLSTGLGIVGVILPLLPSTPFFLLALVCFAKGSKKFHRWFCKTRLYHRYIEPAVHKKMGKAAKWKMLGMLCIIFLISFLLVPVWQAKMVILLVALLHVYYFVFKVKTKQGENYI